uniref:Uncharacterized protein n=1 Tax=Acrobeloides nanus TaxID=290746 RepID=A0A914E5Y4_9BILA
MNNYVTSIQSVLELKNSFASYQNLPLWAGEASSCYNGGAENISDRYAASFLFTDMLGASAFYGLDKVLRQQWFDGYWHNGSFSHYALLDVNMRPNPDYWLAFLYKKLVGQQVYNVSTDSTDPHLRLYAGSNVK